MMAGKVDDGVSGQHLFRWFLNIVHHVWYDGFTWLWVSTGRANDSVNQTSSLCMTWWFDMVPGQHWFISCGSMRENDSANHRMISLPILAQIQCASHHVVPWERMPPSIIGWLLNLALLQYDSIRSRACICHYHSLDEMISSITPWKQKVIFRHHVNIMWCSHPGLLPDSYRTLHVMGSFTSSAKSPIHSCIYLFIHSFIDSFILHSSIHPFIISPMHLLDSCTHLLF